MRGGSFDRSDCWFDVKPYPPPLLLPAESEDQPSGVLGPEPLVDEPGICRRPATGVFGSSPISELLPVYAALKDERVDSASKKTSSEGVDNVGEGAFRVLTSVCDSGVLGSGTTSGRLCLCSPGLLTRRSVSFDAGPPPDVVDGSKRGVLALRAVEASVADDATELSDVRAVEEEDQGAVSSLLRDDDTLGRDGGCSCCLLFCGFDDGNASGEEAPVATAVEEEAFEGCSRRPGLASNNDG